MAQTASKLGFQIFSCLSLLGLDKTIHQQKNDVFPLLVYTHSSPAKEESKGKVLYWWTDILPAPQVVRFRAPVVAEPAIFYKNKIICSFYNYLWLSKYVHFI